MQSADLPELILYCGNKKRFSQLNKSQIECYKRASRNKQVQNQNVL